MSDCDSTKNELFDILEELRSHKEKIDECIELVKQMLSVEQQPILGEENGSIKRT